MSYLFYELLTSYSDTIQIDIFRTNDSCVNSHLLGSFNVITSNNSDSNCSFLFWFWGCCTILKQVDVLLNILAEWVNKSKSSKINKATFKNATIFL